MDGEVSTLEELADMEGMDDADIAFQFKVNSDGTATLTMVTVYEGESFDEAQDVVWEMDDDKTAVFTSDDEEVYGFFEGDYLVLNNENKELMFYFEKVSSFHKLELPDVQDTTEPVTKPSNNSGSGASANSTDIAGKWECCDYKSGESDFDFAGMFGTEISAIFKMEIGSDGKGRLYMFKGSEDENSTDMKFTSLGNGKYSMSEGLDDDEYSVTVDGDTLIMSMATETISFRRVKEFTETDWDK